MQQLRARPLGQQQQQQQQRPAAPSRPALPAAQRRRRPLRVLAVLQEEPAARLLAEQRSQLEALLAPSISGARPPARWLPADDPTQVYYFSYGSHMAFETLAARGVRVATRCPCAVVDPAIRLAFQHRGGCSTLQRSEPGQAPKYTPFLPQVHGVLYQVNKEDMRKLQKREGGYVLTEVEVETYDGWRAKAKTFVSSPLALLAGEVAPTEKYMRVLRDGAADNYLDPLYQAWLSSVETVPSAGLGWAYFNTPGKVVAYCLLSIVALVVVGFFTQQ